MKPPPLDPAAILDAAQDTIRTILDTDKTPDTRQDNTARPTGTPQVNGPGHQDTTLDTDAPDVTSYLYRDALLVLLSRLVRGVLLPEERTLLREHVEHLLAALDRSDDAARRIMDQRQEMAEERYAWQERGRKAERAADLLAGSHRRAEEAEATLARVRTHLAELRRHQADAHPSERMKCVMCGTDPADDLARALDGPAARVDDSSPTPATVVHLGEEQQASATDGVDEPNRMRCPSYPHDTAPAVGHKNEP
ncbi:hypothetical protein ACFW1M_11690 [Streptomyces inhibens]|uniref:hypothetical protein n=1 Tax=Streptomyces inhibens TaxID=2293571 RepID=UPI0036C84627